MKQILLITILMLGACARKTPTGHTAAEALYKDALELKESGRFLLALERVGEIKSQYPYSYYATSAELLQADIYFAQENFTEAAAAYVLFRDFHPKDKKIAYVIWQIAESYFYQLPSTYDRDLSSAYEAIKYYKEIVDRYPNSEYVEKAKAKQVEAAKMLMQKDLYIADFYFKTGVYISAKYRYLDILERYNNPEVVDHSVVRLLKSSARLESYSDCISLGEKYSSRPSDQVKEEVQELINDCKEDLQKILAEENV